MFMDNIFSRRNASASGAGFGYAPLYHSDTVNHCPACGHTHWHIGRSTAECAFCESALPLDAVGSNPGEPLFWYRGTRTAERATG